MANSSGVAGGRAGPGDYIPAGAAGNGRVFAFALDQSATRWNHLIAERLIY
jgi:hypothetical protein